MSGPSCASCGAANEADARFCESCGSTLQRSCCTCGVTASTTARFCRACGASLDNQRPQAVSSPIRKTVTVLFADLAGSTAFEEVVDAETAREVIGQYHELLRSTADHHRAGVTKYIGDGFMAVWGVPEIGADDAGHAVDAAIELQERFVGLAGHLAEMHGVELALRVAVNTGEVVVGAEDADLVGDALNVGARLESECPHGNVVVGEETWRSTRGRHRYDPLGAVQVKGRTAAVPVYQWVARRAETADSIPFVGRSNELQRLRAVFDDAVSAGGARLVTIIGDPGVGKTRLAAEFIRSLGDNVQVVRAHCAVEGSPAMTPLVDMLRTRDLAADIAADVPERDRILRDLTGMTAGVPGSVEEAFWALRRFVEALAAQGSVVLVIDDIQWADNLLLDFIEHLVEWTRVAPVLLVGLARPELRESRPDLVTVVGWVTDALRLRGLEADATAELAARVLGSDQLPEELLSRLPSSTGGNPLFVRELVGMLVHDGVLIAKPGGWSLTVDVDAITVPPTIQALLASRLERLSLANRRVLEVASVIGTDFSPSAVAALAGVTGVDIMSALNRLRRLDLAQPSGTYAGDEPVWRFHHVLIRDVAYRRLLKSERADLHERLANWVHAGGASAAFETDEVIARNLEAAHGYRCDLGLRDGYTGELALRSARNYLASARRALDRDELGSAGGKAARGAALATVDSELHAELLLVGCEAFLSAGDVAAGGPLVDELESVAGPDLAPWATCYRCQLVAYTDPSRLPEVDARLQDAIDEFGRRQDAAGLAKAHRVRAGARARLGRVGDCEADLFEALIAARQGGDHRQITAALGAAPNAALWGPSPAPKAGGRCLDVVRMQRMTTAAPSLEATSLRCLAVLELLRGRPDKARLMLADARKVVAELGLRHGLMETELFAGIIELMVGDAVAAEPHFRVALEGLDSLGVGADAGQAAALLARSVLAQGRLDEADMYATKSEHIAGHNLKTAIAWRSVRAEILAAQGHHDRAVSIARDAVNVAAGTDLVLDHADACLALSRVLAAAADERGARQARREAEALYAAKDAVFMVGRPAQTVPTGNQPRVEAAHRESRLTVANRASALAERQIAVMQRLDVDGTLDFWAEHFTYNDQRRLSGDPVEGWPALRSGIQRICEQYNHFEIATLAVRGEDVFLGWSRWSDDAGNESRYVGVYELNTDGLICYHSRFDEDDFRLAYRDMEARYYAGEGAAFAPNGHRIASFLEAMDRLDVDTARRLAVPNFRWIAPPSALTSSERTLDDLFRWLRERAEQVASSQNWAATIRWLSPTCYIAAGNTQSIGPDGEDYRWTRLYVGNFQGDLLASVHQFELDDEDAAFAYAESLVTVRTSRLPLANAASRAIDRLTTAFAATDANRMFDEYGLDIVYEDRRPLAGDLIAGIDYVREVVRQLLTQYNHSESRHLVVRGDRLCLTWSRWSDETGNETTNLHLVELGGNGLIAHLVYFDGADFWSAYREMETRYYAGEGAAFAANGLAAAEWTIGISQGNIDAVRRVSDPEFRWYAAPSAFKENERSVDDMFRWMQARGDQVASQRHWILNIQWLSPTCSVGLGQSEASGPDDEKYQWNYIFVGDYGDGTLKSVREFDVAAEDEAFAYAETLVASRSSLLPTTNRASEIANRIAASTHAGDVDSAVALYADRIVYEDRRELFAAPSRTVGPTSTRRTIEVLRTQFNRFDLRTLAVRGNRLSLAQFRWSDDAGNQSAGLVVGEIDDNDLVFYQGYFDEGDFEGAYRELERRNSRDLPPSQAAASNAGVEQALAENRGDFTAAFAMFSQPGLVIESRSRSVFPRRTADELRRGLEELSDMLASYRVWASAICWLSDDVMVVRHEREGVGRGGGEYSWSRLYAAKIEDGLFTALCEFDVEDEEAAFAYAEEIARMSPGLLTVTNRGSEVGERVTAAVEIGDFDGLVALYAHDAVYDDRRRLSGDPIVGSAAIRAASERLRTQYSRFMLRTLAVRGDTLSITQAWWSDESGNTSIQLILGEIDDHGRISYHATFDEDDFEAAYRELERRYYAGEGAAAARSGLVNADYVAAMNRGDFDTMFTDLTWPDLVVENRSRSGFPDRTADELRASLVELTTMVSSVTAWFASICWLSPDLFVGRMDREGRGHDGERFEWRRILVGSFHDGRLARLCDFDGDDEDAAFTYARELLEQ